MALNKELKEQLKQYIEKNYDPNYEIVEPGVNYFSNDSKAMFAGGTFNKAKDYNELMKRLNLSKELEGTWQNCVFDIIDAKGYHEPDVYKRAFISKQTFSKIRCDENYQPKRGTAIQMCFGLKLSLEESINLLAKAGFALSYANQGDIICRWFIETKNYDMNELNMQLVEWDCQPLGVLA